MFHFYLLHSAPDSDFLLHIMSTDIWSDAWSLMCLYYSTTWFQPNKHILSCLVLCLLYFHVFLSFCDQNGKKEAALGNTLITGLLTALAALFIANIDLLRRHLCADNASRFYSFVLILIIVSLSLQILCGLLSIFVSHIRSNYRKYLANHTVSGASIACCGCQPTSEPCCEGFRCSAYAGYEHGVISEYKDWCQEAVRMEREASKAVEGLASVHRIVHSCQEMLESYQLQHDAELLNEPDFSNSKRETVHHIEAALTEQQRYLKQQAKAAKFLKTGQVLCRRIDDIHRDRAMERATFLSLATNYMLFGVFTLHAVILGLGFYTQQKVQESEESIAAP